MKQFRHLLALAMSVLTVGATVLSAGCNNSQNNHSHEWVTKVTKEATCTEKGKKTKTCKICDAKETEDIEPSHSLVKYGAQAPTCTVDGWEAYEMCENCDYTTKVVISANGHNFVNGSCINQGCGQKQNDDDNRPSQGGSGSGGIEIEDLTQDVTKAKLSVATFDGGVGGDWLKDAIARFEAKYADATHFQEGTKGVQITLDGDKNKYVGVSLAHSQLTKDVYFTEAVEYYTFVNQGKVADITDVVTSSMAAYGETGTIEDKLDPTTKAFMTAKNGKYYMIPFYDGYYGFIYDVELFEDEGFYFDDNGNFLKGIHGYASVAEFEAAKSNGPDGRDGTYDDGLPATYDQMIALCDRIEGKGYIPFMYSGLYTDYVNRAFFSYAADYEGYDAFLMNKTLTSGSGTAKLAKSIIPGVGTMEATIEFEEVLISEDNAYELQRQAGKYYALAMQEALLGSTKYIGGAVNATDYAIAQSEFINSKYTGKRYAMLTEGVWWENEAAATFVDNANSIGEGKMERKFGFMPVPKVNAAAAGPQTMFSVNSSFGFINSNCQNMELAKEFMRFLHTDAEMSKFSAKTSIPRSLDYEVSAADRATASYFGKTLIDMRSQAKVVYPFSASTLVVNNATNFDNDIWFGVATVGTTVRKDAFTAFQKGNATALEYFNGLFKYQKDGWTGLKR